MDKKDREAEDPSLYRSLLGEAYDALPAIIRDMHDVGDRLTASGHGRVQRGDTILARTLAGILGMPRAAENVSVRVTFTRKGEAEILSRDYGGTTLTTRQAAGAGRHAGLLAERFGPVDLLIRLEATAEGLVFHLIGSTLWGLPLPYFAAPRLRARESVTDGRYHYFVRVDLPLIGRLIEYEGFLARDRDGGSTA